MGSAWRERHFAKKLSLLGIPTLSAVAAGQRMSGFWERASFLMTQEVPGISLERLALEAAADSGNTPPWRERREIVRQLALVVRRLHANRLFHRDLYLCHVFRSFDHEGRVVLSLIDLARMLEHPRRRQRWMVKDLASLAYSAPSPLVTRADRVRFLYHYLPVTKATKPRVRRLIGYIERRAQRIARHDANRKRRLEGKVGG
jgi:heptose I phosphotransferase